MKFLFLVVMAMSFVFAGVDLNSANVKELSVLKGVAAKKAQSIITYRKGHCFKSVDEIVNVKGIGKKTLEKNRVNLEVSPCK